MSQRLLAPSRHGLVDARQPAGDEQRQGCQDWRVDEITTTMEYEMTRLLMER